MLKVLVILLSLFALGAGPNIDSSLDSKVKPQPASKKTPVEKNRTRSPQSLEKAIDQQVAELVTEIENEKDSEKRFKKLKALEKRVTESFEKSTAIESQEGVIRALRWSTYIEVFKPLWSRKSATDIGEHKKQIKSELGTGWAASAGVIGEWPIPARVSFHLLSVLTADPSMEDLREFELSDK